jgi:hypothetical protein
MEYHDSFDNYFVGGKKYYDCSIFYFFKIKTFRFHMIYFIFYLMFFMKLNQLMKIMFIFAIKQYF